MVIIVEYNPKGDWDVKLLKGWWWVGSGQAEAFKFDTQWSGPKSTVLQMVERIYNVFMANEMEFSIRFGPSKNKD